IYSDASKKGLGCVLMQHGKHGYWASLRVEPDLMSRIKEAQKEDSEIWTIVENLDKQVEFYLDDDNVLWQDTRLVVPNDASLREALLTEAHSSSFSIHSGSTKMYHDLKQHFWWSGMKRDVATFVSRCLICQQDSRLVIPNDASLREALLAEARSSPFSVHLGSTKMYHDLKQYFWWSSMKGDVATFVARCLICQQVKIKHQRASGLLQQLDILVWKWDEISMDFVTGLPQTQRRHDAIWVVVDRLTKSAHFLPIRKDYPVSRFAEIFSKKSYDYTVPLQRLYQTETHVSHLVFGKVCRRLGEPGLSSVLPFIPRQTVRVSALFRRWRTCYVHAH
nr:putative reverse transcriptase domain-containing protein [Tanacetum cinerariifolium]